MGTRHEVLGYVIVLKTRRKSNGAKGGGRKGNSGKRCSLFKLDDKGVRTLVDEVDDSSATSVLRALRKRNSFIPTHVSIKGAETFF